MHGFLILGTFDILDWKITCCGEAVLGISRSTEQVPVAASYPKFLFFENKKCLKTFCLEGHMSTEEHKWPQSTTTGLVQNNPV